MKMDTAEGRRAIKSKMATTQLELVHTENCRLLPDRGALLDRLPRGGVVAEIGVAQGDFSQEVLQRNHPGQLYLIDAWSTDRYKSAKSEVEKRFADEIEAGRVHLRQGLSTERLPDFDDGFFDWAYIDTDHSYKTTLAELEICASKVKPGGRIAGHDFCVGNIVDAVVYGVVEACSKFCVDCGWQFEYLTMEYHGHYSFCLKEIGAP